MILHIITIVVLVSVTSLFIFFDTILEWLLEVLDPVFKKFEEKERLKSLGEHSGMYKHFLEEEK